MHHKHPLPHKKDFLRNTDSKILCELVNITPPLELQWDYFPGQKETLGTVNFSTVWLHDATKPNGKSYEDELIEDVKQAVNIIASDKNKTQYTLLVSPEGMSYDRDRFGGNHQVNIQKAKNKNIRMFTFSVRRGVDINNSNTNIILLAIAWN